jgi:hypothetical protein
LARLASPDVGGLPKQRIRSPERPLSPRLAPGRWRADSPPTNRGAACSVAAWAYGVETTGPRVYSPCSRRAFALHRSRIGIDYRCVSAGRSGRAAARFTADLVSGNRLSAGCPGTQGRSTSAQEIHQETGDAWPSGRSSLLHRATLTGRAVLRRPPSVRPLSTGAASAKAQGARPASGWNPLGGAGCVVARQTRVSAGCVSRSCAPRRRSERVPLHRASILHRGLSAAGFIGRRARRGSGAAHRFIAPVPVFKQPNGLLLHRASPSMRCPRAG